MDQNGIPEHNCEDHLGWNCTCNICGRVCHDYEDDDDGTFAASGKVATAVCRRCGAEERYYSDTGTVIGWTPPEEDDRAIVYNAVMKFSQPGSHVCSEHLSASCKCSICGRVCHDLATDDDGTFAARHKVATTWCVRCGYTERRYADTGEEIKGKPYGE